MTTRRLTNIPLQINRVLAGLNNLSTGDLADLGVTPQSARALMVLRQHKELRCALMARLLGLEATSLSHLLRAMSRDQLIVRNRVDNDNRAVEVTLTAKGTRVAESCQNLALAHEHKLLAGLAPAELAAFTRVLDRMCDNVTPPERRIPGLAAMTRTSRQLPRR